VASIATSTVYVANDNGTTVSLISARTNRVTSTITVGTGPSRNSRQSADRHAYVTDSVSNSVSVITN